MQRTQNALLARLARVSPTAAFLMVLVLMLIGLFVPGVVGGVVLLLLAAGLGALLMTTWPVQPPRTRVLRLLILGLLTLVAVAKIL